MKRTMITAAAIAFLLVSGSAFTDDAITSHPGYFPLEELGLFATTEAEIDINLRGSILKMVSGATANADPEFSNVAADLKLIRVLVGTPDVADADTMLHELDSASARLEAAGWYRLVRVRDDDERVNIYVKEAGEMFDGITVMVADGLDEVVLVNIVGTIDPAQAGRLMSNIDDLGDVDLDLDFD